ncbi:MAG: topoisomerase, partial [Thermoleophilaceae bacterium]|nr:topoisomerase [Thermoleophilaceae bacterium]
GFKGRSGRTFRAKLKLEQADDGKWRVEFDEEWAKEPRAKPPESSEDGAAGDAAAVVAEGARSADGAASAAPSGEPTAA